MHALQECSLVLQVGSKGISGDVGGTEAEGDIEQLKGEVLKLKGMVDSLRGMECR